MQIRIKSKGCCANQIHQWVADTIWLLAQWTTGFVTQSVRLSYEVEQTVLLIDDKDENYNIQNKNNANRFSI